MAEEVGFLRHKPGGGRGGKRAPPRSPRRADDPSHGAVTREVLDVARYITDIPPNSKPWRSRTSTGWLTFSGWRKRKAKYLFAPTVPRSRARRMNSTSLLLDCTTEQFVRLRIYAAPCFVGARAQGEVVAQISDAPGQFEFEQRYPHCAPKPPPPRPARRPCWGRAEHSDDPLARGLRFVADPGLSRSEAGPVPVAIVE
jgi:hypothetical protein